MEKYGFVYIWRDKKHKRFYIGCHWGSVDDGYVCSSTWMKSAYLRRPTDFRRKILSIIHTSKRDMFLTEGKWLKYIKEDELGIRYYNKTNIVINHWTMNDTMYQQVIEKMKSYRHSDEVKQRMCISRRKRVMQPHTSETKQLISESLKGKVHSDETRMRIRVAMTGKKHKPRSTEHRAAISMSLKGKHHKDRKTPIGYYKYERTE